jgi:hypothetical protein
MFVRPQRIRAQISRRQTPYPHRHHHGRMRSVHGERPYMREISAVVPSDRAASIDPREHDHTLGYMQRILGANICESTNVDPGTDGRAR